MNALTNINLFKRVDMQPSKLECWIILHVEQALNNFPWLPNDNYVRKPLSRVWTMQEVHKSGSAPAKLNLGYVLRKQPTFKTTDLSKDWVVWPLLWVNFLYSVLDAKNKTRVLFKSVHKLRAFYLKLRIVQERTHLCRESKRFARDCNVRALASVYTIFYARKY